MVECVVGAVVVLIVGVVALARIHNAKESCDAAGGRYTRAGCLDPSIFRPRP